MPRFYQIGDTVPYESWSGARRQSTIASITLSDYPGEKYGKEVRKVHSAFLNRCRFTFTDGHWCYGSQLVKS